MALPSRVLNRRVLEMLSKLRILGVAAALCSVAPSALAEPACGVGLRRHDT